MAGGKSSSKTSTVEIPEELKLGAAKALSAGMDAASLQYSPNRGVSIAGQTPMQTASNTNYSDAANAFGLMGGGSGLAPTQTSANGIQGYSTGALYDQNVNASMSQADQNKRAGILDGYSDASNDINTMAGLGLTPSGAGKGSVGQSNGAARMTQER